MGISRPLASRLIENLEMKGSWKRKSARRINEVTFTDYRAWRRELKGTYAYYLEPVYLLRTQMGEEKFGLLAGLLCECNRISGENSSHRLTGRMRAEAEGNCSCCLNCYGRSSLFRLKGRDFILTLYQELQLNQAGSKALIKNAGNRREKQRHIGVYILKVF